jgi:hypothetical protein
MGVIDTTAQANFDRRNNAAPQFAGELFLDRVLDCECRFCWGKPVIPVVASIILARIGDRLRAGHELNRDTLAALKMLARSRAPIQSATFQEMLSLDDRSVKALMKGICDEWAVPAIGTRKPPYGYFIAATGSEFLEWERVMRSQAIAMLARSRRLFKANFPNLTGQESIDFINQISGELQEAIR